MKILFVLKNFRGKQEIRLIHEIIRKISGNLFAFPSSINRCPNIMKNWPDNCLLLFCSII